MTDFHGFKGAAKRIADIDLPRIGNEIGVGEDELHAVIDVETTGSGFDDQGRPKILFEPAQFYRNLSGAARSKAVSVKLAAPVWGQIPYGATSNQYPRLLKAIAIDETAALKSASWGMGQVMGSNFAAAGFDSVQELVFAMMESEANHLQAMVEFIKSEHLDDDLRLHSWASFARGYNGSGYRKNAYDTKLAAAFAKWSKIPDTKWVPGDALKGASA